MQAGTGRYSRRTIPGGIPIIPPTAAGVGGQLRAERESMAGIKINVRIDDAEVKALLTRLKERVEDLTPVMQTIGQIVRTSVGKNFEQGGRPSKWGTSQRAKRSGGLTLVDTARLKNSINEK